MKPEFLKKTLFYKLLHDPYNMELSPAVIGYEVCNRYKPSITLNKTCFVLHFVVQGKGYLKHNDYTQSVGSGRCFVIHPGMNISYVPDYQNPWSYMWIEMGGEFVKKVFSKIDFAANNYVLKIKQMDQINQAFSHIFNESEMELNQSAELMRVNAYIYIILSILIKEYCVEDAPAGVLKQESQIKKVRQYLDINYANPNVSIAKVAEHFYFNPAYLSRAFKNIVGISPKKYIIQLRMRRAVELLKNNSFSISQIANALGYENQFYFSKEFRDYYGTQPSKYQHDS